MANEESAPIIRRVYLTVPEFAAIDGVAEQVAILAIEMTRRNIDARVFIRRPCASDNQYVCRLRQHAVPVIHPPIVLAFLKEIDWKKRDRILQVFVLLATPFLVLPAALNAVLHCRSLRKSLRGARGYLNRILGRVFHPDYLDRIFHLQLAWHVWRHRPDVAEVSRSDYLWQVDWFWSRGIPVVYKKHEAIPHQAPEQIRSLQRATCCIGVSESIRRCLQSTMGSSYNVVVIPNAVDLSPLLLSRRSSQRSAGSEPSRIALVTRISPEKGVQYLPEIARMVLNECPNVLFLVAGDGPLRNQLDWECAKLGVNKQVSFLGALNHEQVIKLLSQSDIFLLPSLTEGMPVSVIEAMACGTPIVATAVGGTPELIADGISGILVQPSDPEALARAVIKLLQDDDLRLQFGKAGQSAYQNGPWTPTTAVNSTLAVYGHALRVHPIGHAIDNAPLLD